MRVNITSSRPDTSCYKTNNNTLSTQQHLLTQPNPPSRRLKGQQMTNTSQQPGRRTAPSTDSGTIKSQAELKWISAPLNGQLQQSISLPRPRLLSPGEVGTWREKSAPQCTSSTAGGGRSRKPRGNDPEWASNVIRLLSLF